MLFIQNTWTAAFFLNGSDPHAAGMKSQVSSGKKKQSITAFVSRWVKMRQRFSHFPCLNGLFLKGPRVKWEIPLQLYPLTSSYVIIKVHIKCDKQQNNSRAITFPAAASIFHHLLPQPPQETKEMSQITQCFGSEYQPVPTWGRSSKPFWLCKSCQINGEVF